MYSLILLIFYSNSRQNPTLLAIQPLEGTGIYQTAFFAMSYPFAIRWIESFI